MATDYMSQITKKFGTPVDGLKSFTENVIPMPSPSFNWAVGNGGITEGKGVCLFGPESGGKSLIAQLMCIEIQKKYPDGIVLWFDAEYSFNKNWFFKLGGSKNLIVTQTNDPTKIFDCIWTDVLKMLQDGVPIKAIVIDSIKSICYPKDMKKVSTDQTMGGGGAPYLGSAFKRVLPVIREFDVTTIMVQQVYEEMDQYKKMRNPWIVPDGRALKHFCDYMLQVEKIETKDGSLIQGKTLTGSDRQIGHDVRIVGKKNRTDAPYRIAQFTLQYDTGIVNKEEELFKLASSLGTVFHPMNVQGTGVSNAYWQFRQYPKINGKPAFIQWMRDNPQVQEEMMEDLNGTSDSQIKARNESIGISAADIKIDLESLHSEDA